MATNILKYFQNTNKSKLPKYLSIIMLLIIIGHTIFSYSFVYAESPIVEYERQIELLEEKIANSNNQTQIDKWEKQIEKYQNKIDDLQEGGFDIDILESIGKFIFSAILAAIGSLLWGIADAAYGHLGNEYVSNFINFSLNFETIGGSVSGIVSTISSLLTSLAFSLIVLFVLRNILLNYILWRGNPNENPLEVIIGVAMCVAMIAGFSDIYAGISSILGNIINSIGGHSANFTEIPKQLVHSAVGVNITENTFDFFKTMAEDPEVFEKQIFALIISLILFLKLLQALISAAKSGFELLALKVAAPLFCLSLLNNNVSGFGGYLKEIIKRFFNIMLKVAAINVALSLLANVGSGSSFLFTICGVFAGIAVIENSSNFLSGLISGAGGGSELSRGIRGTAGAINATKGSFMNQNGWGNMAIGWGQTAINKFRGIFNI